MNVGELINKLNGMDPEMKVHFAYDYGDRVHTTVTQEVKDVDAQSVKHSPYHKQTRLIDSGEDHDEPADLDDDESLEEVCVLL